MYLSTETNIKFKLKLISLIKFICKMEAQELVKKDDE